MAKGKCLCGSIQLTATHVAGSMGACHCEMCRKWGGGPYLSIDCGTSVTVEGKDHLTVYSSSAWAERGFCKMCGTHLFYRLKANSQYFVPHGFLEGVEELKLDHQIFIDKKATGYDFANPTANMTEAEVFAQFAK